MSRPNESPGNLVVPKCLCQILRLQLGNHHDNVVRSVHNDITNDVTTYIIILSNYIYIYIYIYKTTNFAINGSDNGSSSVRLKAIILTNFGLLWIRRLGANCEIWIENETLWFTTKRLKISSAKWPPFFRDRCMLSYFFLDIVKVQASPVIYTTIFVVSIIRE